MNAIAIDRLDGLSSRVAIKGPCRVATTANITLAGLQPIDGVDINEGDRALVRLQTDASQNGIWIASTGPWRRSKDFSRTTDVIRGTQVNVTDGTIYAASGWYVSTANPVVIDTTSIVFTQNVLLGAAQLEAIEQAAQEAVDTINAAIAEVNDAMEATEAAYANFVNASATGGIMLVATTVASAEVTSITLPIAATSRVQVDFVRNGVPQPAESSFYSMSGDGLALIPTDPIQPGETYWVRLRNNSVAFGAGLAGLALLGRDTDADILTALNVKALNADSAFSFLTTATTINPGSIFGSAWKTAHLFKSRADDTTEDGGYAGFSIYRSTPGGNVDRNDYGLHIEVVKENYLTSSELGNVTAAIFNVRSNGIGGDSGALLINHHQVESASNGSTGVEAQLAVVAATTGTKLREFKAVLGGNIPTSGDDIRSNGFILLGRPNYHGFTIENGVVISGFSSMPDTGFVSAIRCSFNLFNSGTYFQVTGDMHPDGSGRVRAASGSAAHPTYSFYSDPDTGFHSVGSGLVGFDSNGTNVAIFGSGLRIGSAGADQGAGTINAAVGYYVLNNKVIGAQGVAVADATDAASAITQLNALLARVRAHGLIAT